MAQKKRKTKTSQGKHGAGGKTTLTPVQLALLGKGPTVTAAREMRKATSHQPAWGSPKPESKRGAKTGNRI